jgi:NADH:ubiquinone oxidoreductase subunit 6 (subunit J)
MHVVAVAWIFVVVLMALAEGTSTQGTWLGAFFTLLLYGVLPLSIVLYVMGTPMRRRARLQAEATNATQVSADPDGGGQAAGDPLAAEREKP